MMKSYKKEKPMRTPANSGKENACFHFRFTGKVRTLQPDYQTILDNPNQFTQAQVRAAVAWFQYLAK